MRRAVLAALSSGLLAACAAPEKPAREETAVTGTVTYRERILLPPTSTLNVRLEDISLADAPARTLAEHTRTLGPAAPPYTFRLAYQPTWIEPNRTYAVRAEIREPDGRLRFTTTTRHAVITQGAPREVEIVLEAAR